MLRFLQLGNETNFTGFDRFYRCPLEKLKVAIRFSSFLSIVAFAYALDIRAVTAGVTLPVFASFLKQSIDFSGGAGSVMDLGSYCP